ASDRRVELGDEPAADFFQLGYGNVEAAGELVRVEPTEMKGRATEGPELVREQLARDAGAARSGEQVRAVRLDRHRCVCARAVRLRGSCARAARCDAGSNDERLANGAVHHDIDRD